MTKERNKRLSGKSVAAGMARGNAFVYRDILDDDHLSQSAAPDSIDAECQRIKKAAKQVVAELDESARQVSEQIDPYHAEIFRAHRMMLQELAQSREFRREMEANPASAEAAVQRVFRRWVRKLEAEESARYIQRSDDLADLGRRLVRTLAGISVHPLEAMPAGSILIAPRLLPSDAVFFAQRKTAAVVVEWGGPGSHCALMIRQLGIPGLCGVQDATHQIEDGDELLVDGYRESLILNPDNATRRRFEEKLESHRRHEIMAKAHCHEAAIAPDGREVPVMANIANRADVELAMDNGADGVGLYRLEALFMLHKSLPTEEQLLEEVSDVLAPLGNGPAFVRLLDVGSDKNLPYVEFDDEPAPCLGMRGVRVLLSHPRMLTIQLRALLRLSKTRHIKLMVPMITIPEDMKAIREAVEAEAEKLGIDDIPALVAMIETPAAALSVPGILKFADAISLGTNDLAQYTMVAGRQNPLVQHYFRDDHPAVLHLIRHAVKEAGEAPVGICGELAGQPGMVPMLLDAGVDVLSVAPPLVPTIKEAVRHSETEDMPV